MNVADTERAITGLRRAGYDMTEAAETADVVLLNTCSVRERAERKVFRRVNQLKKIKNAPVIGVMGCVAQLEGAEIFGRAPAVDLVIGTRATDRIPALLERIKEVEESVIDLAERQEQEVWDVSPAERRSPYVAFVPIIEGCNKFCSFCIVPYSRGREKSRPAIEIISEVKQLQSLGYREVQLIGQNVNSYRPKSEDGLRGFEGATPFARLLRAVAATGIERVKFTTSFPRDFHPDIVAALEENSILCNWVHLPVQSGSDNILKTMRRGHTVADYLRRVEQIKKSKRNLSLTSDVIVGFPGETESDFDESMKLVEQCQFDGLYIFKYSKRSGTPAAKLGNVVPEAEITRRFLALEELQTSIQNRIYERHVGKTLSVLVEKHSARSAADMTGHSTCNKVVNFSGDESQCGSIVDVLISEAKPNSLYGQVL